MGIITKISQWFSPQKTTVEQDCFPSQAPNARKRKREDSDQDTALFSQRIRIWNQNVSNNVTLTKVNTITDYTPYSSQKDKCRHGRRNEGPVVGWYADSSLKVEEDPNEYIMNPYKRRRICVVDWKVERAIRIKQQQAQAIKLRAQGWSQDSINLFMLIDRRGLEPIFPYSMMLDLDFPQQTFTSDEKALFGFEHYQHLISLLDQCKRARDMLNQPFGTRPAIKIEKALSWYLRFTYRSARTRLWGNLKNKSLVPLIKTVAGCPEESSQQVEARATRKARKLAKRLLDLLRKPNMLSTQDGSSDAYFYPPPNIFIVVIVETVVCIAAYEPLSSDDRLRPLVFLHFRDAIFSDWNAVALAILVAHCRNHLKEIKKVLGIPDAPPELESD